MKSNTNIHRLPFKLSLLAISLFIMMSAVISPALPLMMHAFPTISHVKIELLTTIPNLGMIFGLLISPFLNRKWSPKRIILISLLIVGVMGTLPVILNNYLLILISRIFLGIGIGSYNSLAVSLIPQLYTGNQHELNRMIGFQNIMNNLGYVVGSLAICYLVTLSWHAVFLVYIIAIPVLLAFKIWVQLPKSTRKAKDNSISMHNLTKFVHPVIIWISIMVLLIYIFYMALAYKLPTLIVDAGLGSESTASLLLALLAAIGIPISAAFDWLEQRLHQFVFPLCLAFNAGGFFLISTAHHFWILVIGCIILGSGFGLVMPFIFKWIDNVSTKNAVNFSTTIVLIMMDIGCTISPLVIALIDHTARGALFSSAIFFTLLTIYGLFKSLKHTFIK